MSSNCFKFHIRVRKTNCCSTNLNVIRFQSKRTRNVYIDIYNANKTVTMSLLTFETVSDIITDCQSDKKLNLQDIRRCTVCRRLLATGKKDHNAYRGKFWRQKDVGTGNCWLGIISGGLKTSGEKSCISRFCIDTLEVRRLIWRQRGEHYADFYSSAREVGVSESVSLHHSKNTNRSWSKSGGSATYGWRPRTMCCHFVQQDNARPTFSQTYQWISCMP